MLDLSTKVRTALGFPIPYQSSMRSLLKQLDKCDVATNIDKFAVRLSTAAKKMGKELTPEQAKEILNVAISDEGTGETEKEVSTPESPSNPNPEETSPSETETSDPAPVQPDSGEPA